MSEIKIIQELFGRTIVEAVTDGETMSIKLDDRSILQVAALSPLTRRDSARLHYEIEFSLCSQGIHSWCDKPEITRADSKCEWCGELYGDVQEEAAAQEEQSLDYFNRYIAGDR